MTSAELSSTSEDAAKKVGSGGDSAVGFAGVASALLRRLVLRKWILGLQATGVWLVGLLVVLGAAKFWIGGSSFDWPVMVGVFAAWLLGTLIWSWLKRPGIYEAFAYWDEQGGRSEAFANAWWIESRGLNGPGDELHWRRQVRTLRELMIEGGYRRELPLPNLRGLTVPWLVLIGVCFLPELSRNGGMDPVLSEEARQVAGAEGRKLLHRDLDEKKLDGLTESEKGVIQELKSKVEETAKALQSDSSQSAREVLSELERRARDAEQLAEKFGAANSAWASEKLVAELRKHADTAELGDAVAAKSAEKTAVQAEALGGKLGEDKMAEEVKTRLTASFQQIGAAAAPEDEKLVVGQHVVAVDRHLTQSLMNEGAREMHELADKMRTLAQRERAREQLEKLAQQLRDAGSRIAGQGAQGGMQKLEDQQNHNGSQGGGRQDQESGQGQSMMAMPNAPGSSQMPMQMQMPGGQSPQGQGMQGQAMPMMTPVPGAQPQQGQSMSMVPSSSGDDANGDKKDSPMLFAPIPGQPPKGQPDAMILMPGGSSGSLGGLDAGQGTSPLKPEGGNAQSPAGQSGMVDAQRNASGLSSVRTVEGQARQESATRNTEATVLEAISAEESALDDAALPMARREQVRRYFNELRQRFEGK